MRLGRLKCDLKYMILNHFVTHIPCWTIRKVFYKLFRMKIGKKSRIGINTLILNPENIIIGKNTIINENCFLDGRGGIEIGDNTSISHKTIILTASHDYKNSFDFFSEKTVIKDHVWIGTSAILLNGTTLEDYCVIGAGSVFKGKSEENSIYVGNPSRKVKDRNCINDYEIDYKPYFR